MSSISYKDAGVDIDAGDKLVQRIKGYSKSTNRKEVLSGIGGFAGLFALDLSKFPNPVLVSSTDGVGTKLKLAYDLNNFDGIGQDLVAMCVNDLICCGAEPLFFLDYYATGTLNPNQAETVIKSISQALKSINCTLLGGETAEMPGLYNKDEFDLAGFTVGAVNKEKILNFENVKNGDVLIALPSSGPHSNGYSLVRKIIESKSLDLKQTYDFAPNGLGKELLKPTHLYVNSTLEVLKDYKINAIAHITGGGIVENLPRVLPKNAKAKVAKNKIQVPEVFSFLQKEGNVEEQEMWRVFNMGTGLVYVVSSEDADGCLQKLKDMKLSPSIIGEIERNDQITKSIVEFS